MHGFHLLRHAAALALSVAVLPALAQEATRPVADFNTCEKPVWPRESLRYEQQGKVTLSFLIGEDGAVRDSRVLVSSGYPLLDTAAREGIMRCRFKPGTQDGKPIAAWMKMQYVWTLEGKPRDKERLYEAARRSAERGELEGQLRLAVIQLDSGPHYDPEAAIRTLRRLAERGNGGAQEALALALMHGLGVTPDLPEAVALLTRAAEQGRPTAEYLLSSVLASGTVVARDVTGSERWLRRAAEHGHGRAMTKLGLMLTWRPEGMQEGLALLRKAVAQKEREAQTVLAQCYETGRGVERDYAQALALYRDAAAAGDADAKRGLARLYEQGKGVERDRAAALQLYEEAERTGGTTL